MSDLDDLGGKERDYDGERKHCGCMIQWIKGKRMRVVERGKGSTGERVSE